MRNKKLFALLAVVLFVTAMTSAQTADEIIGKYLTAIGGKEQISQITSVYMEGSLDAMGNQGTIKITQVNGKGQKQEIDVMGTQVVMCVTDSLGWQINPMSGNYSAETVSDDQYKATRDQIYLGGPFVKDYAAEGYKVELQGQETVADVNAYKIQVISPSNVTYLYYFHPETAYLIRTVLTGEMMGQVMNIETTFSDYQKTDVGYVLPYSIETNYGGQFFLVTKLSKVEINQPVDLAIFAKPL